MNRDPSSIADVATYANIRTRRGQAFTNAFLSRFTGINPLVIRRGIGKGPWREHELPDLIDTLYICARRGYWTARQIAPLLGTGYLNVLYYLKNGTFKADVTGPTGDHLFRKDKFNEIEKRWNTRHEASPTWAKERVVITPFGMIRPRAEPDVLAFAPYLLKLPKRLSPAGLRRAPGYNFKDLDAPPSRKPSTHIFASTSLKSVQTRRGRKPRRRT